MAGRASIVGAAVSHVGNVRTHNEDSYFFDADEGMFVVCDGMGGHAAGEVASALAVNVIRERWASNEVHTAVARWLQKGSPIARKQLLDTIRAGVMAAHGAIVDEAARDEAKQGMGTTLVGAVVVGGDCVFAHAGDSRAYLVRDGIAMQLTEDHTLLARLMAAGVEVDTTGEGGRFKSMLTNALGIGVECKVSTFVVPLADGDRFLLCSDGISEYVAEAEVGEVLCKQASPARAAQKLVDLALERGGADNCTALVVRVLEAGEVPQSATERKRDDAVLATCPLYTKLSPQQRLRAQRIALPRDYGKDEKLPAQTLGDRVAWIIIEGEAELDDRVASAGALLYPESLLVDKPVPDREGLWTVTSDVRVAALRSDDFRELCADDDDLGEALMAALGEMLGMPAAAPRALPEEPLAPPPPPVAKPKPMPRVVIGAGTIEIDPLVSTDPGIDIGALRPTAPMAAVTPPAVPVTPAPAAAAPQPSVLVERAPTDGDAAAMVTENPGLHAEHKPTQLPAALRRQLGMMPTQPAIVLSKLSETATPPMPLPVVKPAPPTIPARARAHAPSEPPLNDDDDDDDIDRVPTVVGPPPLEFDPMPMPERASHQTDGPTPAPAPPLLELEPLPDVPTALARQKPAAPPAAVAAAPPPAVKPVVSRTSTDPLPEVATAVIRRQTPMSVPVVPPQPAPVAAAVAAAPAASPVAPRAAKPTSTDPLPEVPTQVRRKTPVAVPVIPGPSATAPTPPTPAPVPLPASAVRKQTPIAVPSLPASPGSKPVPAPAAAAPIPAAAAAPVRKPTPSGPTPAAPPTGERPRKQTAAQAPVRAAGAPAPAPAAAAPPAAVAAPRKPSPPGATPTSGVHAAAPKATTPTSGVHAAAPTSGVHPKPAPATTMPMPVVATPGAAAAARKPTPVPGAPAAVAAVAAKPVRPTGATPPIGAPAPAAPQRPSNPAVPPPPARPAAAPMRPTPAPNSASAIAAAAAAAAAVAAAQAAAAADAAAAHVAVAPPGASGSGIPVAIHDDDYVPPDLGGDDPDDEPSYVQSPGDEPTLPPVAPLTDTKVAAVAEGLGQPDDDLADPPVPPPPPARPAPARIVSSSSGAMASGSIGGDEDDDAAPEEHDDKPTGAAPRNGTAGRAKRISEGWD